MGLMDILNGMQNGPRGDAGRAGQAGGGGMSPLTMALLGLLAYKAMKGFGASADDRTADRADAGRLPGGAGATDGGAGGAGGLGLDDLLRGLGGGAGGLGDLLDQFNAAGKGDAASSWVGTGQNQPISADELAQVLTPEQIDFLSRRTGLSRGDLLAGLSEQLPGVVDGLTPAGRVPTRNEMDRLV